MNGDKKVMPIDKVTSEAIGRVRQEIVMLCSIYEPVTKEVTVSFASPAWSTGFPGPCNYQGRLIEFYWDTYDKTPHLILAVRITHAHKHEWVSHVDHVFEVRPAGVIDWSWSHMESNQSQEIRKKIRKNDVELAAFSVDGFCENSTQSGGEKECDRLYSQNVARPYLNTCLYRLNKGEVLVQPFIDDQLAECGAEALVMMADRLCEITNWYNDKTATLTYLPGAAITAFEATNPVGSVGENPDDDNAWLSS
jgi:hypothetical protein